MAETDAAEPKTPIITLRNRIDELIAGSGSQLQDSVAQHFANIEIERRKHLIIDGLTKLAAAEAELQKIKPDHIIFGPDMKPLQSGWTAAQKSKREKQQSLVDRWHEALTQAINNNDFKKLTEISRDSATKPE